MTGLLWAGLLLGCADRVGDQEPELLVLAAASLTDAFSELKLGFEAQHPGLELLLSVAGSQVLSSQVRQGIQADVFASANPDHVDALRREGLLDLSSPFVGNALVLALSDDWKEATELSSLGEVQRLVVGVPEVPIGQYTIALFDAAESVYGTDWRRKVESRVVSRESNVRLALSRLSMGEADAAIVYASDAVGAEGLRTVAMPTRLAPQIRYHHGKLVEGPAGELALDWMTFVEGQSGQSVLERHGFSSLGGVDR